MIRKLEQRSTFYHFSFLIYVKIQYGLFMNVIYIEKPIERRSYNNFTWKKQLPT